MKGNNMKKVEIQKDEQNDIPVKVLEQSILDIAKAAKQLRASKLTDRAIILLIQDSITGQISRGQIKAVLDAASNIGRDYLK